MQTIGSAVAGVGGFSTALDAAGGADGADVLCSADACEKVAIAEKATQITTVLSMCLPVVRKAAKYQLSLLLFRPVRRINKYLNSQRLSRVCSRTVARTLCS